MFILTAIADLVQITPEDFQKPSGEAITDNINAKYANKVIQKIGLCICLYDILEASDGLISNGTGTANVNGDFSIQETVIQGSQYAVQFRLIVFRPFKGEIITGQINSATELGIKISLGFFDDIWVPKELLHENSRFDFEEQVWIWNQNDAQYYYDKQDWVRLRVESENWHDLSPVAPAGREAVALRERKSPYSITGSMMDPGLGPVQWWE